MAEQTPIYLITEAPKGWLDTMLPSIVTPPNKDQPLENPNIAIVLPIHNEQRCLPSAIGALMLSDIPPQIRRIVLFTNNCSDRSGTMVDSWMDFITCEGTQPRREELKGVTRRSISYRGIQIEHLDTPTPGKANALNTTIAGLPAETTHLINLDANNYLGQGALRTMVDAISHEEDPDVALFTGQPIYGMREGLLTKFAKLVKKKTPPIGHKKEVHINGWFFGINLQWLRSSSIPSIPEVAIEDYALGVKARVEQKKIRSVENAKIWGFASNNFVDRLSEMRRFIKGRLQMINVYPEYTTLVMQDSHFLRPFKDRTREYLNAIKQKPVNAPVIIAKWAFHEMAIYLGKKDYQNHPQSHTWDPISSTK